MILLFLFDCLVGLFAVLAALGSVALRFLLFLVTGFLSWKGEGIKGIDNKSEKNKIHHNR